MFDGIKEILPELINPPDDDIEFLCQPGWTLGDLKVLFDEQEGIGVTRQTYFCGLYQLEDDSVLLTDLMIDNTIRLDVKLPKAGRVSEKEFWAEKDTWLITGSTRNFNHPMKITPARMERIRLPKGKFGIVTLTRGEGNRAGEELPGPRYQVRRYQEERVGRLELRRERGETEVYIILEEGTNGEEEKLEGVLMVYDECRRRTGLETATGVAGIAGNAAKLLKAIGCLVFGGIHH